MDLVQELERTFDDFKPKLDGLADALEAFCDSYQAYVNLVDFYGSEKWFDLLEEPTGEIKAGILSEDQLFNLITDHNQLLGELLELTLLMYKHI